MDDLIAQFTAITDASPERAQQYLTLSDNNIERAIQLFFDNNGADMGATMPSQRPSSAPRAGRGYRENEDGTVTIDSDDEDIPMDVDDPHAGNYNPMEDDEAMARRLQEEAYGSGGAGGGFEEIRAPMARTTETLVGPDADWGGPDDMRAAVAEQMMARQRRSTLTIWCQARGTAADLCCRSARHFQPTTRHGVGRR